MADFSKSFRKGLNAAKDAEENRKEIESVFRELNSALFQETGGKVRIEVREFDVPYRALDLDFLKPSKTYLAIAAHNPKVKQGPVKELAKWSQDRAGYPCRIELGNMRSSCEDKAALEAQIARLLEDPLVGKALYELAELEPDEEADGG